MTQGVPTKNLVERLRAHDPTAVADLSDTYGAKIYQLAFRYLGTARTPRKSRRTCC